MYQYYYTRNYYSKPTPLDIQYEERKWYWENSYDGHGVHEWNIDGKSEYEIINTLKNKIMAQLIKFKVMMKTKLSI